MPWHADTPETIKARKSRREAKRNANHERWKDHPANAAVAYMRRNAGSDLAYPELVAEIDEADASASLKRLRALMADTAKPLYQRISAAEIIIQYELAPGAASGTDPDAIAASSFQFLRAVADNEKTPEALLFRALKCIAQVENTRAQVKNAGASNAQKREMLTAIANAERRRGLKGKGAWPRNSAWAIDEAPWAPGWPGAWAWPPQTLAAALDRPAPVDEFKRVVKGG